MYIFDYKISTNLYLLYSEAWVVLLAMIIFTKPVNRPFLLSVCMNN